MIYDKKNQAHLNKHHLYPFTAQSGVLDCDVRTLLLMGGSE